MKTLLEKTHIHTLDLRNRLVRSATWEGMCDPDGRPSQRLIDSYSELAAGGVGLLISGFAFVQPDGRAAKGMMGIYTDDFEDDYRKMIQAVHLNGGAIAIQIVHSGGQTKAEVTGTQPVAPSGVDAEQYPETPAELSFEDIQNLIISFSQAADRAKRWGADAVQLHGAHGYLINQFLSPYTNRRTDEYGGTIDGRYRFVRDVYRGVRESVGPDFPVLIKLNASDELQEGLTGSQVGLADSQEGLTGMQAGLTGLQEGLTIEDSCYVAGKLSEEGINAIEVSSGTPASGKRSPVRPGTKPPAGEGYNLALAVKIKAVVTCPVITVGGFRSYAKAEAAIAEDDMDFVSLCRPLIREPALPLRWQNGDRRDSKCISCNRCFKPGVEEGGIYCVPEHEARD